MEVNEITVDSYGWYFRNIFASNEKILKAIAKDIQKQIDRLNVAVKTALQPFLAVMKPRQSLLSCHRIAMDLEKALLPAAGLLESIPIGETVSRQRGLARPDGGEEIKYIVVMTKAGWPPLFDIPITFIRLLNTMYQDLDQEAFRAFAAKEITDLYDKKGINRICARWSGKRGIVKSLRFLKEALAAHNGKKYDLSVPMLIAQIEGVMVKINSSRTNDGLEPETFNAYIDSLFSRKNEYLPLKGMIIDGICRNFKWHDKTLSCLSRHAMLHGTRTDYGCHENSLKLILILDMMIHLI